MVLFGRGSIPPPTPISILILFHMDIKYIIAKILSRFAKDRHEYMSEFFRKAGVSVGKGCNITSNIKSSECYLISIGDNTTISTEVLFINHDASVGKIFGKENGSDICGRITIGNNCFIGARATLLYGVTLADNVIVAAGSVVAKSVPTPNVIVGGNPAKVISSWESFAEKTKNNALKLHGKKGEAAKNEIFKNQDKLIKR